LIGVTALLTERQSNESATSEREVVSHVRTVCARRNDERAGDRSRSRTDRVTAVS